MGLEKTAGCVMAGFTPAESSGLIHVESLMLLSGPCKAGITRVLPLPEPCVQFLPAGEGKISGKS